jgi:hypothetical protein
LKNKPVTLRFLRWPNPVSTGDRVFATLLEKALKRPVQITLDERGKVDIEIESVYGYQELPNLTSRAYRFLASHGRGGIDFSKARYSTNQQPSGNARFSIFFTGENERPPFGNWDAYLSFDQNSYGGRNAYLPLWWLTSSDLIEPVVSPYLGKSITIEEMLNPRRPTWGSRKKFCVAFIGKAYPFRMQAIAALSKIGKIDVFGGISRNQNRSAAQKKYDTAQNYKFVFAFENDLFPGYVTEKAPEAWATGAVPLYWGLDTCGYINQKSLLNLVNFDNLEEYVERVGEVSKSAKLWSEIAEQPFLAKKPNLEEVLSVLRRALHPLVNNKS